MRISSMLIVLFAGLSAYIGQAVSQESKPFKTFTQLQKELDAIKAPIVKSIPWESDARTAYDKAVTTNRPLVILFTNAPGPDVGELSEKTLRELEADGLKEFHDKAVFVNVQFTKLSDARDDFGYEIATFLELKEVPYVSFLAPNPTKVTQAFGMEGYFTVEQIKADMVKAIPSALHPKFTWAPPAPAALVVQLQDACKSGDVLQYAACFASPVRGALVELYHTEAAAFAAKKRAMEAIVVKFGAQTEQPSILNTGLIADGIRGIRNIQLVESKATVGGANLRYTVEQLQRNGEITKGDKTVYCIEELQGWRFVPEGSDELAKSLLQSRAAYRQITEDLNKISELVLAGQYKSADEVRAVIEKLNETTLRDENSSVATKADR